MLTAADVAALGFHHAVAERAGTISIHTHGLAKHGVREVEMHGVPACLHRDACVVLARAGAWLVYRRDIGETVASGDLCTMGPTIRVRLRDAEPLRCCDEDQHAMPQTEVWEITSVDAEPDELFDGYEWLQLLDSEEALSQSEVGREDEEEGGR